MVFLSNKFRNNKENNMDINTTPEAVTFPDDLDTVVRERDSLNVRYNSVKAQVERFRRVIENLPWEDINTGNFSPQAGCGDVAEAREEFLSLGCDPDALNEGLQKAYKVFVTLPIEVTVYVESAINEEDAEEQASEMLDNFYLTSNTYAIEVDEIETYSADLHTTEEA